MGEGCGVSGGVVEDGTSLVGLLLPDVLANLAVTLEICTSFSDDHIAGQFGHECLLAVFIVFIVFMFNMYVCMYVIVLRNDLDMLYVYFAHVLGLD